MGDRDKRAISVRLSINSGRHSPNTEPPQGVLVYADAKVNWFFLEGAFVLQSVHKRDHAQLERDFHLYLKRPGSRGDICLNPERDVAEYNIKKDDELEFRHKTLPISVKIDLFSGETRTVEVSSGYPVMDVVQAICGEISVEHGEELSLALAERNDGDDSTTQYQWLDTQSSLNGLGIKDGDTLLLRKKFFILNDDIEEAMNGNKVLCDILYNQIREMFLRDGYVGLTGVDKDKSLAQVCCYLHHIEQGGESISDEKVAKRVVPKCRQKDESFPAKLIPVYFQERLVGLSEEEAKVKVLSLFVAPQSIVTTYYPVKIEEIPDEYVLVCHSSGVTQCFVEDGRLQPVDDSDWRYINIRSANSTNKQKIVSVNVLGSRHEFITPYSAQLARYITESLRLTKIKSGRNMQRKSTTPVQSSLPSTPVPTAETPTPSTPAAVVTPVVAKSVPLGDHKQPNHTTDPPRGPLERPKPLKQKVKEQAHQVEQYEEEEGANEGTEEDRDKTPTPSDEPPPLAAADPMAEFERPATPEPPPQPSLPTITLVEKRRQKPRPQATVAPVIKAPSPLPSIEIHNEEEREPPQQNGEQAGEEEKEKLSLTPVTALSFSPTLHIPEYFGLDFRDVLRDYRLFHVVVMDRDKRSLLLNIKKPVREVIQVACATFSIQDQQRQKLWLPRGKKNILQKYGGKPKKRIGKFLKKTASVTIAPDLELVADKSLEEQYDFEIKPLILHLHYKEPQTKLATEETDLGVPGHDEVDMGQEWPLHETSDVRSYRQFYQSWCGAIQGAYPMTKVDAIRLAALLTHVYYGDRTNYKSWPPADYDVKAFLPEIYWRSLGIASDVEKVYKRLSGKTVQECIIEASEFCSRKVTHQGVFYEVTVPGHDVMFHRKKMHAQLFGINSHGVFSISKETGEVIFTHRFSDIYDWQYGENTFKLNFSHWSKDYNAYTYQREEILDTLQLYINMTRSGRISQAPSRPPSAAVEDSFSLEEEKREGEGKKISHLGLAHGTNSPQFSINLSHSPESSPEPEPTPVESKGEVVATPDSVREVVMTAV